MKHDQSDIIRQSLYRLRKSVAMPTSDKHSQSRSYRGLSFGHGHLTVLYFHVMRYAATSLTPDRDRFILSKGHSVESLYCTLAKAGYFPDAWLDTYGSFIPPCRSSKPKSAWCRIDSGLSPWLVRRRGIALGAKMDAKAYRTFV
jgi:transketolase N-terminal domain/subunit